MKIFYIVFLVFLVFLINLQIVQGQNATQRTSEIQIDVKTEALEKTIQSQQLSLEINKNNLETPRFLSIDIEDVESVLTLVSAKLNNADLWLINSSAAAKNDKVIAWNFDKENYKLVIYPYSWNSPYVLDLNIQVNLKNISSIEANTSTSITMTSELRSGLVDALPTGRGNEIQIR